MSGRTIVRGAGLCLLAALAWWAAPAFAGQQDADFNEAQGEAAFIAADYAHAFHFFELAFQADPTRTWTLHRMALCALHLGQYDKAEALLRQVLERPDARPDATFDLGLALYLQRRYHDALAQFDRAEADGAAPPTIDFYRGACLYRLGHPAQALPLLQRAYDNLPGQRVETAYYLGAAELALSRPGDAIKHLEEARQAAPPGSLHEQIDLLLVRAREKQRQLRWWAVSLDIGGGWDSNIFYEPEDFPISRRAGPYVFGLADIALYPLRGDWGHLGVGYDFYQSAHIDTRPNQDLSSYDLTRHGVRFESMFRFGPPRVPLEFDFNYEWSTALLAGDNYETAHTFDPSLAVFETPWTATQLGAVLELKHFNQQPGRNAFYASPSLAQAFTFLDGRGRALAEVTYEHDDAESDEFAYRGFGGYVAGELPIVGRLSFLTGFRARYLDYWHSDVGRLDRKFVVDAALRYQFLDWLSLSADYSFQNNVSLKPFSYEKHVYLLDLGIAL